MNYADEATIRAALLDIIDGSEDRNQFAIYHPFEDDANTHRTRMADALIERIREFQENKISARLENFCPRHVLARLPKSSASWCTDCVIERMDDKSTREQ